MVAVKHKGFRDALSQSPGSGGFAPPWLSTNNSSQESVGGRLMYGFGLAIDALLEKMRQGIVARMPGIGTNTALPYISLDRLITQGPNEDPDAFAARVRLWLDDWRIAGSARSIMQQFRGYVSPFTPRSRTVDNTSNWYTYIGAANPETDDPSVTQQLGNWDWDSSISPGGQWWRFWAIEYATSQAWVTPDDVWGAGTWGDGLAWGFSQEPSVFDGWRSIVKTFKGAHAWCLWMIVSFDDTLFDPTQFPGGVNPDGTWGHWGKVVGTTFIAARSDSARYCDGVI